MATCWSLRRVRRGPGAGPELGDPGNKLMDEREIFKLSVWVCIDMYRVVCGVVSDTYLDKINLKREDGESEWDGEEEGPAECECPEEAGSQGTQHSLGSSFLRVSSWMEVTF